MSFVIASYGALRTTLDALSLRQLMQGKLSVDENLKWDFGLLDESHFIKSPRAKRTKASFELRDACIKRMCLTGTPIANSLFDLYAQWEFLEKYLSGFSNYHAFAEFYSGYEKGRADGNRAVATMTHVPLLQERLARTSMIISKKEALPDLPEKVYDTIEVSMTAEQAAIYTKVATQLYVEIENDMNSDLPKEMTVNNVLTKLLRLAQVTSGFVTWDAQQTDEGEEISPQTIDRLDPNPKLDELIRLLKEDKEAHEKTIIWATFVQDIQTIKARCDLEEIDSVLFYGKTKDADRKIAEERFNCDPACRVFIGNPAAGGVGLNLLGYDYRSPTDGSSQLTNCNHVIYYSQNWSLTARAQSEDRAHRRGTRTSVRITDLMIPGSIDQEIRLRVTDKRSAANLVTNIHKILRRIANPNLEIDNTSD